VAISFPSGLKDAAEIESGSEMGKSASSSPLALSRMRIIPLCAYANLLPSAV